MNNEQKLTPKYWVAHNTSTDDVYVRTMFKHRQDTLDMVVAMYGDNWEETHPNIKIDLIELKVVQL